MSACSPSTARALGPTFVFFLSRLLLNTNRRAGEERDPDLERHLQGPVAHAGQRCPYHGAEESSRSLCCCCCVADGGACSSRSTTASSRATAMAGTYSKYAVHSFAHYLQQHRPDVPRPSLPHVPLEDDLHCRNQGWSHGKIIHLFRASFSDAALWSSFGFGQVGGTVLILHPRFVFVALDPAY